MRSLTLLPVLGILVALAALLITVLVARARVTSDDVAWLAGSHDTTPDEQTVYADHLGRHRTSRLWWGGVGLGVALAASATLNDGHYVVGTSAIGPAGDILFCLVTGIAVGALLAESYRLRRPSGPASAARPAPSRPSRSRSASPMYSPRPGCDPRSSPSSSSCRGCCASSCSAPSATGPGPCSRRAPRTSTPACGCSPPSP